MCCMIEVKTKICIENIITSVNILFICFLGGYNCQDLNESYSMSINQI
jgi:hypothetical protein